MIKLQTKIKQLELKGKKKWFPSLSLDTNIDPVVLVNERISNFEKENQDHVEIVPAGWEEANSKLVSLIQAGEAPDIMITGSRSLRQFAELGALKN